jgi:hypothetical protein
MDYYFERISDKNLDAFVHVFNDTFNKQLEKLYFSKKFDTDHTGIKHVGYIAFSAIDNSPAAFYGVYPCMATIHHKKIMIAQSGDTATLEKHRKKGLFKALHDLTVETSINEGIQLIYGFPNPNSHPGFTKFNWSTEGITQHLRMHISVNFLIKIFRKLCPKKFIRYQSKKLKKTIIHPDMVSVNFQNAIINPSDFHVVRNSPYLNYKINLGSILKKLNHGIALLSIKGNILEIGELFSNNKIGCINELIDFAAVSGFDALDIKLSKKDLMPLAGIKAKNIQVIQSSPLIIKLLNDELKNSTFSYTGVDFDTF